MEPDLIAVQITERRWVLAKPKMNTTGQPELMDGKTPIYEVLGEPMGYVKAVVKARDLQGGPTVLLHPEKGDL